MFYKILVVGLDRSVSSFLQAITHNMSDATVRMAANHKDAAALVSEGSFDMILCSLAWLEKDGKPLIKTIAAYTDKPALAIMNVPSRQRMIRAFLAVRNLGLRVVGVISKPADVVDLRAVQGQSRALSARFWAQRAQPSDDGLITVSAAADQGEAPIRFNPRINLLDGRVVAVEAVVDQAHSRVSLEQVLDSVISAQQRWQQQGYKLPVWIKLPLQMLDCPDFPAQLHQQILGRGGSPRYIGFDLIKGRDGEHLMPYTESIYQLGLNGFALSHDDFGLGYGFYFKLDYRLFTDIKIFLPLLRSAITNEKLAASLACVVTQSKQLGFTVVADDVLTQEELMLLHRIGCDEAQGRLIGGLVDERGVIDLLMNGSGDGHSYR